jgi:hypothetical protein
VLIFVGFECIIEIVVHLVTPSQLVTSEDGCALTDCAVDQKTLG